jgi:hypothetical protein
VSSDLYKLLDSTVLYVKGTAVPLQAWSGPEDSRKLRFSDFMTTAQDGGKAFYRLLTDFLKSIAFWKVRRVQPFVLLVE